MSKINELETTYQKDESEENLKNLLSIYLKYVNNDTSDINKSSFFLYKGAELLKRRKLYDESFSFLKLALVKFHHSKHSPKNVKSLIDLLWLQGDTLNHNITVINFRNNFATKLEKAKYKTMVADVNYKDSLEQKYNEFFKSESKDLDKNSANHYIKSIEILNMVVPKDSFNNSSLIKAASLANLNGNHKKALRLYNWFLSKNPKHELAPVAHIDKGIIYEQNLKDLDNASMEFETVINNFSDQKWKSIATSLLKNLGRQSESIIDKAEYEKDLAMMKLEN